MTRNRRECVLLLAGCVLGWASPCLALQDEPPSEAKAADPIPIRLIFIESGRRIDAALISTSPDEIEVEIGGVRQRFARTEVQYEILRPVDQQADEILANLEAGDVVQRLMVAEWLIQNNYFERAGEVVREVLAVEPGNAEAAHFDRLIRAQLALNQQGNAPRAEPDDAHNAVPPEAQFPLLTPEQIALIKVYENNPADRLNVSIEPEAVQRFLQAYADHPRMPATEEGRKALVARGATAILDKMYEVRARDFYAEVKISGVPGPLLDFRDRVNSTWLVNSCATNDCHGGKAAGQLSLTRRGPKTEPSVFTNFYILEHFKLKDGTALINYNDPTSSPLLQLGLPRDVSLTPHPVVPGDGGRGDAWRAVFRNQRDPKFKHSVDWIEKMFKPRPDYVVDYPPKPAEPR